MVMVPGIQVWAIDDAATRETLKGIPGVMVWVGDMAPDVQQSGVTQQQVQTEVERQVRRAGITVFSKQDAATPADVAFLTVSVTTLRHTGGLYVYAIDLAVYQTAALLRDPTPRSLATWTVGSMGLIDPSDLRAISTSVSQQVEQFIQAYRAVHPRARPEGGRHAAARARLRQDQERLQAAGLAPGPLDGQLGLHTRAALRRCQQRQGLRVTGTLDVQIFKALSVQ
jgi:hypothetical protein